GLALAEDLGSRLGAVELHELGEQAHLREVEILEQRRKRDETVNPARALHCAAKLLQLRQPGPFDRLRHFRAAPRAPVTGEIMPKGIADHNAVSGVRAGKPDAAACRGVTACGQPRAGHVAAPKYLSQK